MSREGAVRESGSREAGSAASSRLPSESDAPTPEVQAEHARGVAGNLRQHREAVTASCAAMTAATNAKEWEQARAAAERQLASLRQLAAMAAEHVARADDDATRSILRDGEAVARDAAAQLEAAPARPTATLSPGYQSFLAALPPASAPRRQDGPAVVAPLLEIIDRELVFDDLDALVAAIGAAPDVKPRFERLSETARALVTRRLTSPSVRGRLIAEHNARLAAPRPAATKIPLVEDEPPPAAAPAPSSSDDSPPEAPGLDRTAQIAAVAAPFAAQLGVAPTLITGEEARGPTEAHGTRGIAVDDQIAIHPDVDPASSEGREVVAHEVVHHAQAQLPATADAGRDAAEDEARSLAQGATGGVVAAPRFAIALTTPAAHGDAKQPSDDELPPGVKYQRVPGTLNFRVRTSWLGTIDHRFKIQELLEVLRDDGALSWVTPAQIDAVARATKLGLSGGESATTAVRFGPHIFTYLGLPPGARAMVGVDRKRSLTVTVTAPGVDLPPGTALTLDPPQFRLVVDALSAFCQLAPTADGASAIDVVARTGQGGPGVVTFTATEAQLGALFGPEPLAAWWKQHEGETADGTGAHAMSVSSTAALNDLADFEVAYIKDWLAKNLPHQTGAGGHLDRSVRELIVRIENSPHRAKIIENLGRGDQGNGVNGILMQRAFDEAVFEAEGASHGIKPPDDPSGLNPVWNVPVPFRIDQRAGRVLEGESVPFEIAIDQPASFMQQAQLNELRFRPFTASIDWVFEKVTVGQGQTQPASTTALPASKDATGVGVAPVRVHQSYRGIAAQAKKIAFDLPDGESTGTWKVTAFVRHSHYLPGFQSTLVEVKSADLRMQELRDEVSQGMGESIETDFDFDSGAINNRWSKDGTDLGRAYHGQVPAGWKARTSQERHQARQNDKARLAEMLTYLRDTNVAGGHDDAIAAAERQLSNLKRTGREIAEDLADHWIPFELRGTYLSRQAGLVDGPLDLHGLVKVSTVKVQDTDADGERQERASYQVQIRDLSRRFDNDDRRLRGEAATFDDALAEAFVDLCQAYPPGRVFVNAQVPGADGAPSSQTLGFELNTGSKGRDIKEQVFDPAINIAVNAAGLATMIFVPGSATVVLPALAAYNISQTVDDIYTQWVAGTLTSTDLALDVASIGLDLLPFLGRARAVAGSSRALFILEGVDIAGDAVFMTAAALTQARAVQEQQVAGMAQLYEQMVLLEKSTHPSDPRLVAMRAELESQAVQIRHAVRDTFGAIAKQRGIFFAAQRFAHGAKNLGTPTPDVLAHRGFDEQPGKAPYYDRDRGIIIGDPKQLDDDTFARLSDQQATHMRELAVVAADDLGIDPSKVEVVIDTEVSVSIEPGRVRLGYSPRVRPDQAVRLWKAEATALRGGGGGGRGRGGDSGRGDGHRGDGPPRGVMGKVDEVGRSVTVLVSGVRHEAGGEFVVDLGAGTRRVAVATTDDLVDGYELKVEGDEYRVRLPRQLADSDVETKLAAALADASHAERRRASGDVEATSNALGADGQGTSLSPRDYGMLAELRVLRRQRMETELQGASGHARIAELDLKIKQHESTMGFDSARGPELRRLVDAHAQIEDDRLRADLARSKLDGDRGHPGMEFHTHWMGIVDVETFRAKAAIARTGGDYDGSWLPLLEQLATYRKFAHTVDGDGNITQRSAAGDAYAKVAKVDQELRTIEDAWRARTLSDDERLTRRTDLEPEAQAAARAALIATPETDFNSAYEMRDELVKDTWAGGKKPRPATPGQATPDEAAQRDAFENAGYDAYTREALLALARDGVGYTEPSNSASKMKKRFTEDRVEKVVAELIAEGKLAPGQVDVRFLTMVTTNHFGDRPDTMPATAVRPGTAKEWADTHQLLREQILRKYVGGIDIAGQEFFWFDRDVGGARLRELYGDLIDAARERGERLVLRPHVGEGAVDTQDGKPYHRDDHRHRGADGKPSHYERARHNLDAVLSSLEELQANGVFDRTLVDVRFGHATHATPEQARRMQALGITAEVNLGSNVASGALDQTDGGIDGKPRNVEQYDDHALPTLLYYDTSVVLSTDAHAVMDTTMRAEYQRARRVIDQVLSGDRRVRVKASDAADRGVVVGDDQDSRWLGIHELTSDERTRFLRGYEKLYADAESLYVNRPGATPVGAGNPRSDRSPLGGRHASDLIPGIAKDHQLTVRADDATIYEGTTEHVQAAAAAYQRAGFLRFEEQHVDGLLVVKLRSEQHELTLRVVPNTVTYQDLPLGGRPARDLDSTAARSARDQRLAQLRERLVAWEAEGVSLEERARRAWEYRQRADAWSRDRLDSDGGAAVAELHDSEFASATFDDLVARRLQHGSSLDDAHRDIIATAVGRHDTPPSGAAPRRGPNP